MNSVIKFAMAASALALVACSGKGSADATLDGQEFFKDDSSVYCRVSYKGELMACGLVPASKCTGDLDYEVASSCPSDYRDQCLVDHATVYVYSKEMSCDDIEPDDDDDNDYDSDYRYDDDYDEDDNPIEVSVHVRTATARFFTSKFVIEVVYSLEDDEVADVTGKVWKKK